MSNHKDNTLNCSCQNGFENDHASTWRTYIATICSFLMLVIGLFFDHFHNVSFFEGYKRLAWYIIAYLPIGLPVLKKMFIGFNQKSFFTEFTLMSLATIGAFFIGEYAEGVAVILFYSVGEHLQDYAVDNSKRSIKALLDVRPETASVWRNGTWQIMNPADVKIGDVIQVKVGERVPLDGRMKSLKSTFNTAALTGESKPKTIREGETVLAGIINTDSVVEIITEKLFSDSSLSKILDLVQNASERKSKTELKITRFAKIYTPIVFLLAVLIVFIPYLFISDYILVDWIYRALVFLVISCPCALVISIPLGYFSGIGAASKYGILFKGANYLDLMARVNTVVMDKTGTLTQGVFKVQHVTSIEQDEQSFIKTVATIEQYSTHPIAKAIVAYANISNTVKPSDIKEISGHGLQASIEGEEWLVGNGKLMTKHNIVYPLTIDNIIDTTIIVAKNKQYIGHIVIADSLKPDAKQAVSQIHQLGIRQVIMLSGDKPSITNQVAELLDIDVSYGNLLPENKVAHIETLKASQDTIVLFVGDGINDTPALALSDVGVAMGGLGSDAAIEVADVIIQTDQPSKIATAIRIAQRTDRIVHQNMIFAISVKVLIMILGALGFASMWAAVFADVGVALLAIFNSIRILHFRFS